MDSDKSTFEKKKRMIWLEMEKQFGYLDKRTTNIIFEVVRLCEDAKK